MKLKVKSTESHEALLWYHNFKEETDITVPKLKPTKKPYIMSMTSRPQTFKKIFLKSIRKQNHLKPLKKMAREGFLEKHIKDRKRLKTSNLLCLFAKYLSKPSIHH